MTQFAAALKEYYTADRVQNLALKKHNFLKLLTKMTKFEGSSLPIPTGYSMVSSRSSQFNKALANKNASKIARFTLYRKAAFGTVSLTDEVIKASKGNAGAFMEAQAYEFDNIIESVTDGLAQALQGNGSGVLATISNITGQVITLSSVDDALKFEIGQVIETVDTSTDTVDAVSHPITKVDRSAGKLTVTGSLAGASNGHGIVNVGDYKNVVNGLAGWLPLTAPTSGDSFNGVDRSVDERLSGVRFDGSALPIDEAIIKGHARITQVGQGRPDLCLVSFDNYANLVVALGSKVRYIDKATGELGFQAIKLESASGPVEVVADLYVPNDRAYMLEQNTWKLYSLDAAPHIFDLDGQPMLRDPNTSDAAPSYSCRIGYYAELGCTAIGRNGVIKLK